MKKFVGKLILLILIVAAITGAVNYVYVSHCINLSTMKDVKNDSAYIENVPTGIEVCNFGNSHGYYGFDYGEKNETCFNFALPSQSLSYDYRIMDSYKENIAPDSTVIICVSYLSFFGPDETSDSEFESMNKRYYHFLDKEHIKEYDFKTKLFVHYLPGVVVSDDSEWLMTLLGRNSEEDMWSEVTDAESAAAQAPGRYKKHVADRLDENGERIFNEEEIEAVYDMIKLCKEIGARPVLVTPPFLAEYTDEVMKNDPHFLEDFYGVTEEIKNNTGVEYYDYSFDERFVGKYELFMNTDHLNKAGAEYFTDIIWDEAVLGGF